MRHRLAQVSPPVQERDKRAAAREPDSGLAGGVTAPYDSYSTEAAQLRLGRAGSVEHACALVVREIGKREPPVLGACSEDDGSSRDLVSFLEPDDVAIATGLEAGRAVWGCGPRAEFARL